MWLVITDLPKAKQAPALALSLTGRKRELAREIPLSELNHDDGVTKLREKLNCFAKNEVDTMYEIFVIFENLKNTKLSR